MRSCLAIVLAILATVQAQVMLPHRHAGGSGPSYPVPTNTTILTNGTYDGFPGLAQFADGKLFVAYRSASNHVGSVGDLYYVTSSDRGNTWTAPTLLYHDASGYDARTGEAAILPNGNVFVSFHLYDTGTTIQKGAYGLIGTNGNPIAWASRVSIYASDTFATEAKAITLNSTNVAICVYGITNSYERPATLNSYDNGVTWTNFAWMPTVASKNLNETEMLLVGGTNLVAFVREEGTSLSGSIYRSTSADMGTNWTAMEQVLTPFTSGRPSWIWCTNGAYYMVTRGYATDFSTFAWNSDTYGWAWNTPVQFKSATNQHDYSSLIRLASGNIGIATCLGLSTNIANSANLTNAWLVYDEVTDPAFRSLSPTNLPNAYTNNLAWWVAADYVTNAGVATLADRWSNGYTLTNKAASSTFPTANTTNTLSFDGSDDYLRADNFAASQPNEYDFLINTTNVGTGTFWFDSRTNTTRQAMFDGGSPGYYPWLFAGSQAQVVATAVTGSKFELLTVVFNGSSSQLYQNLAQLGFNANPGTDGQTGFTLGGRYTLEAFKKMTIYEGAAYSRALSAVDRRNLYWYWTNKYNIAP